MGLNQKRLPQAWPSCKAARPVEGASKDEVKNRVPMKLLLEA